MAGSNSNTALFEYSDYLGDTLKLEQMNIKHYGLTDKLIFLELRLTF